MKDLKTFFTTKRGVVKAVNGVSYSVEAGRTLGVVGESGSGKSVSAMSILQLLDGNGYIESGEHHVRRQGADQAQPRSEMQKIRGNDISVIFQEPMTSLEPGLHRGTAGQRAVHDPSGHDQEPRLPAKVVEMLEPM